MLAARSEPSYFICMSKQLAGGATIRGRALAGASEIATDDRFQARNPATAAVLEPAFSAAGAAEVSAACALAEAAFPSLSETAPETRATFLKSVAAAVDDLGAPLIERAGAETGLPQARLDGERARTVGQLRPLAGLVRSGEWIQATIDPALPDRKPLPRPDLRRRHVAVGPVAVCGLHEGVFSYLPGPSRALGSALVADPRIKAVGFTGSRSGGLALMRVAAARPEPIPVYAEMSAVNPVLLLPGALRARSAALAAGFVQSLTLGAGQFCTSPGLLIGIAGPALDAFAEAAGALIRESAPHAMLTADIRTRFEDAVTARADRPGVTVAARGAAAGPGGAPAALLRTDARHVLADPALSEELFGPAALLVSAADPAEIARIIESLGGPLTATLHLDRADEHIAAGLVPLLARKAGRILANGWPTGVAVAPATVQGGPFPATSDGRSTSVGTLAIERFLRPVCYQDLPDALLPPPLRPDNPWHLPRRIDGALNP